MINLNNLLSSDFKKQALQDDLEKLSNSFRALKETINDVSSEANSTAIFLKENSEHVSVLFLSLIDMIDDIIIIKDYKNRWKILNKTGLDLFKIPYDELLNFSCLELADLHPHLYDTFIHCHNTDELAWNSKTSFRETMSFSINDNWEYFDIIKTPIFNMDGSRKELIAIGRNITDLKSENLRNKVCFDALNAASDNICIFNAKGTIIFCNDNMIKEFKLGNHNSIEGKHINTISNDDVFTNSTSEIWQTINNNISWKGFIKLKDLKENPIKGQTTILPVMNGSSHPSYFICMIKTKYYCRLSKDTKFDTCCNKAVNCLLVSPNSSCQNMQCGLSNHE
jgi:PAS domain-containing protein